MALVTNPPQPAASGDNGILLNYHAGDSLTAKGITATRSGSAWQRDPTTGLWSQVGTNVWRDNHLPYSAARNARNFIGEPGATNIAPYGTLYGTNGVTGWTKAGDAAATLAAVDDHAQLASDGLYNAAAGLNADGYVLVLDNTAGVSEATASVTLVGTLAAAAYSFYIFAKGGSGHIRLHQTTDKGSVAIAASAAYQKIVSRNVTMAAATATLVIAADAGQKVYFFIGNAEQGTQETTPIPNSTSGSVSRAADKWTTPYGYPPGSAVLYMRHVAQPIGIGQNMLCIGSNGSTTQTVVRFSTGALHAEAYVGGVSHDSTGSAGAYNTGDDLRVAARFDAQGNGQLEQSVNGAASSFDTKAAGNPGYDATFSVPKVTFGSVGGAAVANAPVCGSHLVIGRGTALTLDQLEAL